MFLSFPMSLKITSDAVGSADVAKVGRGRRHVYCACTSLLYATDGFERLNLGARGPEIKNPSAINHRPRAPSLFTEKGLIKPEERREKRTVKYRGVCAYVLARGLLKRVRREITALLHNDALRMRSR